MSTSNVFIPFNQSNYQLPVQDVHGCTMELPDHPDLEFRIVTSIINRLGEHGYFLCSVLDKRGKSLGSFGTAGATRKISDSLDAVPTNRPEAMEYIRYTMYL